MKQNGYGGANTLTGLVFEGEVDQIGRAHV